MTTRPVGWFHAALGMAVLLAGEGLAQPLVADWRTVEPDPGPLRFRPMGQVRFLSIHHTQTPVPDSVSEIQRLRNIQHFHQAEKGWGDIAYHFLIGSSGTVYEGRSVEFASASGTVYLTQAQWEAAPQDDAGHTQGTPPQGTLAPGATAGHVTVCFIGDFSLKPPTAKARKAAVQLLRNLMDEHGLDESAILMHREIAATDCPGQALYDWFRGKARARSGRGEGFGWLRAKTRG